MHNCGEVPPTDEWMAMNVALHCDEVVLMGILLKDR